MLENLLNHMNKLNVDGERDGIKYHRLYQTTHSIRYKSKVI
jgi:hypothetical protein